MIYDICYVREKGRGSGKLRERGNATVLKPTGPSSAHGMPFKAPWQNPNVCSCGYRGRDRATKRVKVMPKRVKVSPQRVKVMPKLVKVMATRVKVMPKRVQCRKASRNEDEGEEKHDEAPGNPQRPQAPMPGDPRRLHGGPGMMTIIARKSVVELTDRARARSAA